MILADTSVWIDHFRNGHVDLAKALSEGSILMHTCVCGELACGNLKDREVILNELKALPFATQAGDGEASKLIEHHRLWGRGLGWIDVHLLASALLSNCRLWTLDRRLAQAAGDLGLV